MSKSVPIAQRIYILHTFGINIVHSLRYIWFAPIKVKDRKIIWIEKHIFAFLAEIILVGNFSKTEVFKDNQAEKISNRNDTGGPRILWFLVLKDR